MKYDAVIFDLFGTLVDNYVGPAYMEAQARMASLLGVAQDELLRVWQGMRLDRDEGRYGSLEGDIAHLCGLMGIQPEPALVSQVVAAREEGYLRAMKIRPDSVPTLQRLRSSGHRTALVSDCGFEIPRIWRRTPLAPHFDATVFSAEARCKKPDPRMYQLACDQLGVTPDRCLYVGDGGSRELTGAKAVGMHPVLIRVEYERELDQYRLDAVEWTGPVIYTIEQVLDLV
jgi:putative hydrolase of the HAD superfamily